MARAYIGLGSNLGDGRANLLAAWRLLGEREGINRLALSSPYLTTPVAKPEWLAAGMSVGTNLFTNGVGLVECYLSAHELLRVLLKIEQELGRDRSRTVDRPIDLDLLYYDELVLDEVSLRLPHPELQNRIFVLAPLAELAPDLRHPRLGLTSLEMLRRLPDGEGAGMHRLNWEQPPVTGSR